MSEAQCVCGALRLKLPQSAKLVAACHCLACQRRTGTPFSVNAFYATDAVEVSGTAQEYMRVAESGRKVRMYFCPACGSTLYWKLSIFERDSHHWVSLPDAVERFQTSLDDGKSSSERDKVG